MKKISYPLLTAVFLLAIAVSNSLAQNPIIRDQFTADPSARVFGDKMYVYPSHDVKCDTAWFCMKDYHVFSSSDLTDWTDHGVIVSQDNVPWVDSNANAMWAPDAIKRNGTYYFYFPAIGDSSKGFKGRRIGVATSKTPSGPFTPQPEPIKNVYGIDPNIFIDSDGQAYLYWAGGELYVAKLKDNMRELASGPKVINNLPVKGLKEGPFLFKRNDTYYLTYPHVAHQTERLEYATSDSPMGPFKVSGVMMDETSNCWTNHQSVVKYQNQWYLFYHHNDYSPDFDKNRSIRADSLVFNPDGSIQKVTPTLRGVGITDARSKIQIDRYSQLSKNGASIAFLDPSNMFEGWKTLFDDKDAWIQYNAVDFGMKKVSSVNVRAKSKTGSTLEIHLDNPKGPLVTKINIPETDEWNTVKVRVPRIKPGVHNLVVSVADDAHSEVDWIRFD